MSFSRRTTSCPVQQQLLSPPLLRRVPLRRRKNTLLPMLPSRVGRRNTNERTNERDGMRRNARINLKTVVSQGIIDFVGTHAHVHAYILPFSPFLFFFFFSFPFSLDKFINEVATFFGELSFPVWLSGWLSISKLRFVVN